jgi:hypothetical protein
MGDDKPNYSSWSNPWGPMAMPMQQWIAAMRAATEAWSAFMPGAFPQGMWNAGCAEPAASGAPAVSVRVLSHRPAIVTTKLHLNPGAECAVLSIGSLTDEDSGVPLDGVSIGVVHGMLQIKVLVMPEQPLGRYHGEIVTADGRIAGGLSVSLAKLPPIKSA